MKKTLTMIELLLVIGFVGLITMLSFLIGLPIQQYHNRNRERISKESTHNPIPVKEPTPTSKATLILDLQEEYTKVYKFEDSDEIHYIAIRGASISIK